MEILENKYINNVEGGKTLLLERRGCNFWNDEPLKDFTDFENYRYFIKNLIIYKKYQIKDFARMCAEISRGVTPNIKHVGEETKKRLKERAKSGKRQDNLFCFNDYSYNNKGECWGHFTKFFNINNYWQSVYNSSYCLWFINFFSKIKYKNILIINNLNDISKELGEREKAIFENLAYLVKMKTGKDHNAFYFYDANNNYFIFDFANNKVVG